MTLQNSVKRIEVCENNPKTKADVEDMKERLLKKVTRIKGVVANINHPHYNLYKKYKDHPLINSKNSEVKDEKPKRRTK